MCFVCRRTLQHVAIEQDLSDVAEKVLPSMPARADDLCSRVEGSHFWLTENVELFRCA